MLLEELGYNEQIEQLRISLNLKEFDIGRVIAEHKERYIVRNNQGEYEAEITGNMRYTAENRLDYPAVGDWVALTVYDQDTCIIHSVIPRYSLITRQAVGGFGEVQIIACNIDYAFIVQAVDRDLNINRIERYLTICQTSDVSPMILLTKTDLITEEKKEALINSIEQRVKHIPVMAISNESHDGIESVKQAIKKGKTYCMLGSSGVGKSTLINLLAGKDVMKTGSISESTGKGKHVTVHRELIVLETGGILIDNPGMREVGIADHAKGLEATFDRLLQFAQNCKFKDCTHTQEAGCRVMAAVESGELGQELLENYRKMQREKSFFESSVEERKRKEKIFGKIIKDYQKKDIKGRTK